MNQATLTSRTSATTFALWRGGAARARSPLGFACGVVLMVTSVAASADTQQCERDADAAPRLQVITSAGEIGIRLYPDAAPNAVATLTTLVTEPLAADAKERPASESYYYNGLSIGYTRPHIEIRTSRHHSADVLVDHEIDAEALGLHEQRITTAGQAMNAIQDELLPAYRQALRTTKPSAQLESWVEAWYDGYKADFLVGVSRRQINEALGQKYTQGLASRPVLKGSVTLKPASAHSASPVLSIALKDMPQRTGWWMVVGEVVQGLELAERISTAPLDRPTHFRSRTYKPRDPVVIESVRMECG